VKTSIRYEIVPYDDTFRAAVRRPPTGRLPLENASVAHAARQAGNTAGRPQRTSPLYGPGGAIDSLSSVPARGVLVDVYA
jgi:hypothetical protein